MRISNRNLDLVVRLSSAVAFVLLASLRLVVDFVLIPAQARTGWVIGDIFLLLIGAALGVLVYVDARTAAGYREHIALLEQERELLFKEAVLPRDVPNPDHH